LWAACLLVHRPQMDELAERVAVKARFDDIVLPPADVDLLRQIAGQVRSRARVYEAWGFGARMNRGFGISALFSGESGTGKTMAAEVIANELGFDLYRIDLATVVSKYIGETEKNLRRLFDAAEGGGVILFFDEADALFGKRSEVKDSHDRYANIEVNYLLQKMESFRGLSILATNRKSGLDAAFLRRIRFVIDFPFPGPAQARELWTKVFPSSTPTRGLDLDRLARLKLTGGSIHSVALHAAFLAAGRNQEVDTDLVLEAARVELRRLGRPLDEGSLN
jgi:SpoVK/Ycf46/Vps4 family AAA+-type ATPase